MRGERERERERERVEACILNGNVVQVVIFGQDPYPRAESATGIAFYDGQVTSVCTINHVDRSSMCLTSDSLRVP
jgi:hypothetical protein